MGLGRRHAPFADRLARIAALKRRAGIGPAFRYQCLLHRMRSIETPAFRQRIGAGAQGLKAAVVAVHHLVSPSFNSVQSMPARRPTQMTARSKEALGRRKIALFRSEEHTSELQSLMRRSYAVFCLKKKIYKTDMQHTMPTHIR